MTATIHTLTFGATQQQVQDILDAGYAFNSRGDATPAEPALSAADLRWIEMLRTAHDDNGPSAA